MNHAWANYVKGVLDKHGATARSQRSRTGISHTTINSWLDGTKPGYEGVVDFAKGMGESLAEALIAAGYEPVYAETGHQIFVRGVAALAVEFERPIPVSLDVAQAQEMSGEDAERTLAVLRRQMEEGAI